MRTFIVAEVGINHNGSRTMARQLVKAAAEAGVDAVKFQKRTPEQCVPQEQWLEPKETPWGDMPYIEYRRRMEFGVDDYVDLFKYAKQLGLSAFFSVWDEQALADALAVQDALGEIMWPAVKVPSAKLTDHALVRAAASVAYREGCKLILSTGMSTKQEVVAAHNAVTEMRALSARGVTLLHCHSAYPAPTEELNLRAMEWLAQTFYPSQVGYSGHEYGLEPTVWAVVLGATMVERHITLDHTLWGTDQKASVPPEAFKRLVAHIRGVEQAMGDGVKRVWDSELPAMHKLRGTGAAVDTAP